MSIDPSKPSPAVCRERKTAADHEPAEALAARLLDGAGAAHLHPVAAELPSPGPVLHGRDDLGNLLVLAGPERGSGWEPTDCGPGIPVHLSITQEAPFAWLKVRLADLFLHGHLRSAPPLARHHLAARASDSPHLAGALQTWKDAQLYVIEPTAIRVRTPLAGAAALGPGDVRYAEADRVARDSASLVHEVLALPQDQFRGLVTARARSLRREEWGPRVSFEAAYPVAIDGWGLTALAVRRRNSFLVRVPFARRARQPREAYDETLALLRGGSAGLAG